MRVGGGVEEKKIKEAERGRKKKRLGLRIRDWEERRELEIVRGEGGVLSMRLRDS